jgi:hypothetical protein
VPLNTLLRPPSAKALVAVDGAERKRERPRLSRTITVIAAVAVFLALVVPDTLGRLRLGVFMPGAFLRIPLEGIVGAALLIVLPRRARRITAVLLGAGLGVLTVLKVIDMGFRAVLARRFDVVLDPPLFGNGFDYLHETFGSTSAIAILILAVLLVLAVPVGMALCVVRLGDLAGRRRRLATRTVTAAVAAWVVFALVGTQLYPAAPVASTSTLGLVRDTAVRIPKSLHDQDKFLAEARDDAFADTPATQLLTGLRGKDVVIGVVESYGRAALEKQSIASVINPSLAAGAEQLKAAGFSARSGWLTSSTYGGGSWLAHASFQSGLWINNQGRYRQLTASKRMTLTNAFKKAGWQTVGVEPGNDRAWPEASFYGYDEVYDARNLGYQGPRFGWSNMPDQYTLASFQRNVYGKRHAPLMAEITLTSSHSPWTVMPDMVDWNTIGDGSVYTPMASRARDRTSMWQKTSDVRAAYAKSIAYSLTSLTSWTAKYGDHDLVMIMFGDHQPVTTVSGSGASHDIPITVVAKDPKVLERVAGWGWEDGLKPGPNAPVWKMNEFRDRFLTTFGAATDAPH